MKPESHTQPPGHAEGAGADSPAHAEAAGADSPAHAGGMGADARVDTTYDPVQAPQRVRGLVRGLVAVLAVGLVLTVAWRLRAAHSLSEEAQAAAGQAPTVSVVKATGGGAAARPLVLPGETAAWFESTLYARVNGYVARFSADIGDVVHQGQVLALIDTPELDAQLAAAQAQLNAGEAQVRVRESEAALAQTTYARWRDAPRGVVSEQEREEKKAAFDSAQARLGAARAQTALDRAEVDRYAALARFKNVTAPFDGVVTERRIDIGNLVTAGSTAATQPLYHVSQTRPIRVFVEVPQPASGGLQQPGLEVSVRTSALPGRSFTGKVARTAQAINPQARTLRVEVDLPNADGALVPGMFAEVSFAQNDAGLVRVPAAALLFRSSGPQVAVVDDSQHVHLQPVVIARDEGNVLALSSGVAEGDRVVLNLSSQIADGQQVEAVEMAPASAPGSAPAAAGAPTGSPSPAPSPAQAAGKNAAPGGATEGHRP